MPPEAILFLIQTGIKYGPAVFEEFAKLLGTGPVTLDKLNALHVQVAGKSYEDYVKETALKADAAALLLATTPAPAPAAVPQFIAINTSTGRPNDIEMVPNPDYVPPTAPNPALV